jgi:hypothetical protein
MRTLTIAALLALSGCATTNSVDTTSGPPGSACLKGAIPNLGAFYGSGTQAIIEIREIDGVSVKPEGWRSHCVSPGNHQIGFLADSPDAYEGFRVAEYIELDLRTSGKYVLRGDFEGINLILHVLDVSNDTPSLVQDVKFKISGSRTAPAVIIPTPIPVHK